jgi:outer membrane protein TolC
MYRKLSLMLMPIMKPIWLQWKLKSSKLALDFADKSYAAGRTTIYDVNVARNNYANAQDQ